MDLIKETFAEIVSSPVNAILVVAIAYLTIKIYREATAPAPPPPKPKLQPMKKQDLTVEQLKEYDGSKGEGRILVAIRGKIFDVTPRKSFYGRGGAYSSFAGRDASRALALFQVDSVKEEYDDLSDITPAQMQTVIEWEEQFEEKYDVVGKLLKPGEEPAVYDEPEKDSDVASSNVSDKKSK